MRSAPRWCGFHSADYDGAQVELECVHALKIRRMCRIPMSLAASETSGFDGLISTSNHLVPEEDTVFVETSRPIWWVAELRADGIQ